MTLADFLSLVWEDGGLPLIEPRFPSPILADPTFLFPYECGSEASGQAMWNLFAHGAFGIERFESKDGLAWTRRGLVLRDGMRAFVRLVGTEYFLLYERYRPFALPLQLLPKRPRWKSRIELRRSPDLETWSPPEILLEADFPWARDPELGDSVSNPCLVRAGDVWRLWFSASLVHLPDCGFDEPKYVGCAVATNPGGPFGIEAGPRIQPLRGKGEEILGAGSIKVLELDDGWIGLQNRIYEGSEGRSRSAIFLLASSDGLHFEEARPEPLLAPSPEGWRSSHVYACDCRIDRRDGLVYLYYNARDGWYKTEGKERIGRIVGRPSASARRAPNLR
jgi:hypothetical protein